MRSQMNSRQNCKRIGAAEILVTNENVSFLKKISFSSISGLKITFYISSIKCKKWTMKNKSLSF